MDSARIRGCRARTRESVRETLELGLTGFEYIAAWLKR